jgi:hypothetical protein
MAEERIHGITALAATASPGMRGEHVSRGRLRWGVPVGLSKGEACTTSDGGLARHGLLNKLLHSSDVL